MRPDFDKDLGICRTRILACDTGLLPTIVGGSNVVSPNGSSSLHANFVAPVMRWSMSGVKTRFHIFLVILEIFLIFFFLFLIKY